MIDIYIPESMVAALRGNPHTLAILNQGQGMKQLGIDDDLVTAFTYGALCAVRGVVMSAPTGLDRLQGDYFWQGVENGERLTD
jgi:hypothetical protein